MCALLSPRLSSLCLCKKSIHLISTAFYVNPLAPRVATFVHFVAFYKQK